MSGFTGDGYKLADYGSMASDLVRVQAYADAMRRVITPESIVLEIGTGSGVFAMHACQLGAKRVYAIEVEDAIESARTSAAANGFADRIVFYHAASTQVTLPEHANVLISDLRGTLPLHNHHLETIADARARLLQPDAIQLPQTDTIYFAPVSAPESYQERVEPWKKNPFGLNMDAGRSVTINAFSAHRVKPEEIVLPAQVWAEIDYRRETALNYARMLTWTVDQPLTVDALQGWFEAQVFEDIRYRTSPDQPALAYNTAYFPLAHPVTLQAGETLSVFLRADNAGGLYTWSWTTRITGADQKERLSFQQSTFFANLGSGRAMRQRAPVYQPGLNRAGAVDAAILGWMAEGLTVGVLSQRLIEQFPDQFPTYGAALAKAGEMSVRYGDHPQE